MGCFSSKILTRSSSFREELQKRMQRRKTDSNEKTVISKTISYINDQSSNQPSITKKEESKAEDNIETINTWELLAGLEDDNEVEVRREEQHKEDDGEKGLKRKIVAKELKNVMVPKLEILRTESLRDWLSQGGQVFSPESYITPRFGRFETADANGDVEVSEKIVFDPNLVAQLEVAMEEMIIEEDEMLRQIV